MPPNPSSSRGEGPRSAERFAGRIAIVTGAAQGIGRAICERLLQAGAAGIVTFDRRPHDLGDERCLALVADVSDPAAAERSVELCLERFGRLDLMAAHAGIADPRPLLETDDGVRVNAVAPGVVDTAIAELVVHNPDLAPAYLRTIPLGRFGQPRDIADAVLFLGSDEAAHITGQMLVVDGGQTLGITGDLQSVDHDVGGP